MHCCLWNLQSRISFSLYIKVAQDTECLSFRYVCFIVVVVSVVIVVVVVFLFFVILVVVAFVVSYSYRFLLNTDSREWEFQASTLHFVWLSLSKVSSVLSNK